MDKPTAASYTQEYILRIADQMFTEKGFFKLRIRDIAEYAGISEALIYKYFHNKEDLYTAVFQWHCEKIWENQPAETSSSPLLSLYHIICAYIYPPEEDDVFSRLLQDCVHMQQEYNVACTQEKFDIENFLLKPLILQAQEAGQFIPGDAGSFSRIIWKFTLGSALCLIQYPNSIEKKDVLLFFSLFTPDGSFDPKAL